jgi:hypothetical protein
MEPDYDALSEDQKRDLIFHDPLYEATRAWVKFIQGIFMGMPKGIYKWSPNVTETEIVITDQNPAGMEKTNKRPFIITKRGPAVVPGVSRDLTLERSFDGSVKKFGFMVRSTMTFVCVAKYGVEAQNIAYHIAKMIEVFKPLIQRSGRIHFINNQIQITPETEPGSLIPGSSFPEWKAVQVVVPFVVQDVISVEDNFHTILRAVKLQMNLD